MKKALISALIVLPFIFPLVSLASAHIEHPITKSAVVYTDNLIPEDASTGLLSGVGSGTAARKVGTEALERIAKEIGVNMDEMLPIANDIAKKYKISSIDDLKALKGKLSVNSFTEEVRSAVKAKKVVEVTKIKIGSGLQHVLDRHVVGGTKVLGKSIFSNGEDVVKLIEQAEKITPIKQTGGNFERIVDAGRTIGTDKNTGKLTSIYTVITDTSGNLVTAFPGKP